MRLVLLFASIAAAREVVEPASAGAAEASVVEVGTWTRNPTASAPPEGGVAVANAPDGAVTVSAIRFDVSDGGGGTVVLRLHQSDGVAPGGAAVQLCPTPSAWEPATNGDFADAPQPACDLGAVALAARPDGSWSADITRLLSVSDSLLLLPAAQAPAIFSLSFDPPAAETTGAAPPPPTREPASDPPASSPSPASDGFGVAPGGSFSSRPSELAAPPPAEVPQLAAPAAAPAASTIEGPPAFGQTAPGDGGSGRDVGQALRLGLLSLAVGAASVPILRLKDGGHVPLLSRAIGIVRAPSRRSEPANETRTTA